MSFFSRFLKKEPSLPSPPLPFVTRTGVDLGNKPIQDDIINEFNKMGTESKINDYVFFNSNNVFVDVSKEIETYINGADFAQVTAGMAPPKIEEYRRECWNKFQNTLLVPAINRMVSNIPNTKVDVLSPPEIPYPSPAKFLSAGIKTPLSQLEFFATNLYTKITGDFYYVLNRVLLQMENEEVCINARPYNEDKKVFNVWFYLFLSGLQKLIVPVPAFLLERDDDIVDIDQLTVRLYRGMPVDEKLSNSLWENPKVSSKKEDAMGNFLPDQVLEDNKVTYYTSLGFSSYSTNIAVSCGFAYRNSNPPSKPPNMIVYEPQGGQISLPSLQITSDVRGEDEYLTFPNQRVVVFLRENGVTTPQHLNETCSTTKGFPPGILMDWIGITDAPSDDIDLSTGITLINTKSGGRRKNKRGIKRSAKRSAKRSGAHRRRYKKTRKGNKYK